MPSVDCQPASGPSSRVPARCRIHAATVLLACSTACVSTAGTPRVDPTSPPSSTIVFVGDSLVHRSAQDHGMLATVRAHLARLHPANPLDVIDAGVNGDRIADIRERLDRDVLALKPEAIVIYFDSDVSDVDDVRMTAGARAAVRAAYEQDLRAVLARSMSTGAWVCLSGPTLLGEEPPRRGIAARHLRRHAARVLQPSPDRRSPQRRSRIADRGRRAPQRPGRERCGR
jgi:hypothetical protein